MEPTAPYFDDAYRQIANDTLAACACTEDFLNRCKECGLKVDDEVAGNGNQQTFLAKFKQQFFPNLP